MIVHLEGTLVEAGPLHAVVDVQGVGYGLAIPVSTAEKLPRLGERVRLLTHVVYREDAQLLYGFATAEERSWFRLLSEQVTGIGPKIALSILSHLSIPVLRQAILSDQLDQLAQCPGIGKKTAARLCVELKDKIGAAPVATVPTASGAKGTPAAPAEANPIADAVAALVVLGYKLELADKSVRQAAERLGPTATTQDLIKGALR